MYLIIAPNLILFLGGDYDWRKRLTLPNILKEFNSRLKGMSTGGVISINIVNIFNEIGM